MIKARARRLDHEVIRVCLLTSEELAAHPDGQCARDDQYLIRELESRGCSVSEVAWNRYDPISAGDDIAVVRTTWDYTQKLGAFLQKLEEIGRSTTQSL